MIKQAFIFVRQCVTNTVDVSLLSMKVTRIL